MYNVDEIKLRAEVSTIYTEQHPEGIPGFIHWTGTQAIYCHPVDGGYVWTINGERVREGAVSSLLTDQQ